MSGPLERTGPLQPPTTAFALPIPAQRDPEFPASANAETVDARDVESLTTAEMIRGAEREGWIADDDGAPSLGDEVRRFEDRYPEIARDFGEEVARLRASSKPAAQTAPSKPQAMPAGELWTGAIAHTYSWFSAFETENQADGLLEVWGTAFHIGGGAFLTAGHNIFRHEVGKQSRRLLKMQVCFADGCGLKSESWLTAYDFRVKEPYDARHDPIADIGFFRVHRDARPRAVLQPQFTVPFGQEVRVAGHVEVGKMEMVRVRTFPEEALSRRIAYNALTKEGMSGGPVFTGSGACGVHTSLHFSGTAFAVPFSSDLLTGWGWRP